MNRQLPHQTVSVPAARFGSDLDSIGASLGYLRESLTDEALSRIPALNPLHLFSPEHYRSLALWWRLGKGEPLYISGPSGSGKTSTALQFCARLGVPVVSVTARARMDRRELIGHYIVRDGATIWQDGPATLAWRYGWTLIINEFSAAPAEMWLSTNDVLNGEDLEIMSTGEIVPRHPDARIIVTDNTRGHSVEIDEGFYGRQIQDRSVIDRFWHMRMECHSEEMTARLLFEGIPPTMHEAYEKAVLKRFCDMLAKAGADSLSASRSRQIGFQATAVPLSVRALSRLRDMLLAAGMEDWGLGENEVLIRSLFRASFTEALDATARETAEGLLRTALGNIIRTLRSSHERISLSKEGRQ